MWQLIGPGGILVPSKIIRSAVPHLAAGGRFYFVTSSLSDYEALIQEARRCGTSAKIVSRKKIFFEELLLVCCTA